MVFVQWRRKGASFALWPFRGAMIIGLLALGWYLLLAEEQSRAYSLEMKRNFYGALRVREYIENAHPRRSLTHGTIRHGYQFTEPAFHSLPTSYYSESSGVGRALLAKDDQKSLRVGVIGLGVGTLLSYARPSDHYFVYEINPDVLEIAQSEFTYLSAARERHADIQIFLGDARLTLEDQAAMQFDVLAVDAFSSDAIPVHLLTNEAFAIYARHLKPDGVLAIHISNKYLDLAPICEQAARQLHRVAKLVPDPATALSDASNWVLITADERLWQNAAFADARVDSLNAIPTFIGWTDQYSSMWRVLKLNNN
jgi:SAM-dependent methyltransferase